MFAIYHLLAVLQTQHIHLGNKILRVEIANTSQTRERGLMGRCRLLQDCGMLFVFEQPQVLFFWMKNTYTPLSIAFFDESQTLFEILEMPLAPLGTPLPSFKSSGPALYALEVPQRWYEENHIRINEKFSFLDLPD